MILVGDRGILTEARLRAEVQPAELDWISTRQREVRVDARLDRIIARHKRARHCETGTQEERFLYRRHEQSMAQEAALDGFHILRTSVPVENLTTEQTVTAYQSLSRVERAFRSRKSVDRKVRLQPSSSGQTGAGAWVPVYAR